ncbi:MAG: hypothetical protein JST82_14145 [Bacteroidetes bacterium]|nr:hypothetical protein [Bacteroidota bacterium]
MKQVLKLEQPADNKLSVLFSLCDEANSLNNKEVQHYATEAYALAKEINDPLQQSLAAYYVAFALQKAGLLDSSLQIVQAQLSNLKKNKSIKTYRRFLHLNSTLFVRSNKYKEGIDGFYNLLRNSEESKDTIYQVIAKRGIGWVNMEMSNYPEALKWSHNALNTAHTLIAEKEYAVIYSNIAAIFNNMERYDSGEYYINKAIIAARKYYNLSALANALNIKAGVLMPTNRMTEAEQSLKEALGIRKMIGDPYYILSDMNQLAEYYLMNKQSDKAIEICKQGIDSATHYDIPAKLYMFYHTLSLSYKAAGDMKNYSNTLEAIIALNDTMYKKNTSEALAEIQAKYNLQKKDNIIIRQQFALARNNYFFYGLFILSALISVFAAVIFFNYRKKQKFKLAYLLEDEKRQSVNAIKDAEERERKRIAADLHDNLGVYAASIASNIEYITNMSDAENKAVAMRELKTNSQSMVSQLSDTIWALKKDELSLTNISDRLKIFIQRIQVSYPHINIEVREDIINDLKLPPSQAFHLFCIMQEAVTNALKHSNCSEIIVVMRGDKNWDVSIADNGTGIPDEKKAATGNGLSNMKMRAEASGYNIEWINTEPRGTVVCITSTTN